MLNNLIERTFAQGLNIFISGPSGSGKSKLLSDLMKLGYPGIHLDSLGSHEIINGKPKWIIKDVPRVSKTIFEGNSDNISVVARRMNVGLIIFVVPSLDLWRSMQYAKFKTKTGGDEKLIEGHKHASWIQGWLNNSRINKEEMMAIIMSNSKKVREALPRVPFYFKYTSQEGVVTQGWHES